MSKLEQAAKQLLEHWDTPLWKQTEMTGTYINALRKALVEQENEIDWIETNKALAKEIIELQKKLEELTRD